MADFMVDVHDYLNGSITKTEFIERVNKGVGTNNSNGAYDFKTAVADAQCMPSMSYAENKMLVEAFDEICYGKVFLRDEDENGKLEIVEDRDLNETRAAVLGLLSLSELAQYDKGNLAIERFYKEQNRDLHDESHTYLMGAAASRSPSELFFNEAHVLLNFFKDEDRDVQQQIERAKNRLLSRITQNRLDTFTAEFDERGIRGAEKIAKARKNSEGKVSELNQVHPQPLTPEEARKFIADPQMFIKEAKQQKR